MSKQRRLLLLAGNFSPELTGIGKYNGEMIEWLAGKGFDCTVISTYPYYPQWEVETAYRNKKNWYHKEKNMIAGGSTITIYRCPHAVPKEPSGKTRMLLDFTFATSAFFVLMKLAAQKKYDYVMTVSPPLPLGVLAVWYKKIRKAKFLHHIQDLQIDAAANLGMIRSPRFLKMLFSTEKFILKNADVISTVSEGMIKKIKAKINRNIILFPNWADTKRFFPKENKNKIKQDFGFEAQQKVILYSGAIGEKQGLESIIEAAHLLKYDEQIKFVICGSGPYKTKLQAKCVQYNLSNVIFLPLQSLDKFNDLLNMADVHLVMQKANAEDLVMPSKLVNILAAGGLALITANKNSALYELVKKHNIGIIIPTENQQALNEAVINLLASPHENIKQNARNYAENSLSINSVLQEYVNTFAG